MGLLLAISCLKLPLKLPNLSLHSPQAPIHSSGKSLSQILEVSGGISGTNGYAVLLKTTQWNSINKHKQNTISVQVISNWKACDPSSHSILLLSDWPSKLRREGWYIGHWAPWGLTPPQRLHCSEPQAPGRLTLLPWGIGNQAQHSSLGSPMHKCQQVWKRRGQGHVPWVALHMVCTLYHNPPSIRSLARIVRLP